MLEFNKKKKNELVEDTTLPLSFTGRIQTQKNNLEANKAASVRFIAALTLFSFKFDLFLGLSFQGVLRGLNHDFKTQKSQ